MRRVLWLLLPIGLFVTGIFVGMTLTLSDESGEGHLIPAWSQAPCETRAYPDIDLVIMQCGDEAYMIKATDG